MRKDKKDKIALKILLKISKRVSYSLDLEKVSAAILKEVKNFLKTDYSALFLLEENSGYLILAGADGFKQNQVDNLKVLAEWERINEEVIKKSQAIVVNDILKDPSFKNKKVPFLKTKLSLGAFLAVPLKTHSKIIGVLVASNHKRRKAHFVEEDRKLLYTLANHVSVALLNAKLHKDLKNLFLNTITSLVAAVDARDPYTHGHSDRVVRYASAIAEQMKCEHDFMEDLKLSALLHDVGKIGIRDNILSKKTKLNQNELVYIYNHPLIGSRIVDSVINSSGIIRGIEEHHERFDGKGYPKKLKGAKISLEGRIIAVVDTFDTLTSNRPYQKALTSKEAILEIRRNSGKQFDPQVVRAFQESFSKQPNIWRFK